MAGAAARSGDCARSRAGQMAAGASDCHRVAEKGEQCVRKDLQRRQAASANRVDVDADAGSGAQ